MPDCKQMFDTAKELDQHMKEWHFTQTMWDEQEK